MDGSTRVVRTLALRITAIAMTFLPITALAVASRLEPDLRGLGTHQQLGLPPCSMRALVGIRCPSCGMTTSWAYFTRGEWKRSFQTNAGGFLLAFYAIYIARLSLGVARSGSLPSTQSIRKLTIVTVAIGAVTLVDWILRLSA